MRKLVCKGRLNCLSIDYSTNQQKIEIQTDDDVREAFQELFSSDKQLDIEIKVHREKRSLDANAYAWVLMTKIAGVLNTSKEEVYEIELSKYGTLDEEEDGCPITMTVLKKVDMSNIPGHWMKIKDNGKYCGYAMIKGSSKYDTKEMSVFIDGIISDCKELGIETMTPDEIERIKAQWGNS